MGLDCTNIIPILDMLRIFVSNPLKRWKSNKPVIKSEPTVPSTFIKRITKKKNLKQVVYEKKKSDTILNEG